MAFVHPRPSILFQLKIGEGDRGVAKVQEGDLGVTEARVMWLE